MRRKSNILIVLTVLLILVLGSVYAYSMYASSALVPGKIKVATWSILVNDCNIVDPTKNPGAIADQCFETVTSALEDGNTTTEIVKNFRVTPDNITYYPLENESLMDNNKIAPGTEARFNIKIDAGETEAAFKYNLKASYPGDNAKIKFYIIETDENWVALEDEEGQIKEHVLTSSGYEGMIYYSENAEDSKDYLQVKVVWENDNTGANDIKDTNIATCKSEENEENTCEEEPVLKIPVSIIFEQITSEQETVTQ